MDPNLLSQAISSDSRKAPLLPDIGIVAFVPEEWGGLWMVRQQVLTRLSKYFHVVWMEPARGWRRHWLPGQTAAAPGLDDAACPPGFIRYPSGRWLPRIYRPASLGIWMSAQRVRSAKALLRRQGCRTTVFYLWRQDFAYALDAAAYDLSCYHIDDEYSFSTSEQPLDVVEVELMKRVDQVFVHSPALLEKKGKFNPRTLYVTNGVDYHSFAAPHGEPEDMKDIPHPRIGYVGNIKTQLDIQLLCALASQHPEWSLVLVGPKGCLGDDSQFVEQLARMRNVYFLGHKPVSVVCAYPQHMDVCLLPYKINDYTKYIYPLKLHEYLASGKPVVGAPIRSLESFGHVIRFARTVDEWATEIAAALSPLATAPHAVEQRRAVAREYDWDALVARIAQALCERLGSSTARRFAEVLAK